MRRSAVLPRCAMRTGELENHRMDEMFCSRLLRAERGLDAVGLSALEHRAIRVRSCEEAVEHGREIRTLTEADAVLLALFGVEADKIQVLVHPQSIVHSAVQFRDGGVKAQLGVPDMRLPIQYAFSFPERLPLNGDRLDLFRQPLEFFEPDMEKFRCLAMAYEAIRRGGNVPCIMNAANEVVNEAFRHDRCGFLQMADIIEATMQRATFIAQPTYDDYIASDAEARRIAASML